MKYVVTSQGPIDRHEPGEDVTGLYDPETLERLTGEGYLEQSHTGSDTAAGAIAGEEGVTDGSQ